MGDASKAVVRCAIDTPTFKVISNSSYKYAFPNKEVKGEVMKRAGTRTFKGEPHDLFVVEGVGLLYKYTSKEQVVATEENPKASEHALYMSNADAHRLYGGGKVQSEDEPIDISEYTTTNVADTTDEDFGEVVG
jgi:hypothetical protein